MQQANAPQLAHSRFCIALESYLTNNFEVQGVYVGVVGQSPDPSNGTYSWKVQTLELNPEIIRTGAQSGFNGWNNAMKTALLGTIVLGADQSGAINTTSPCSLMITDISIDFSSKPTEMQIAFELFAQGLVNSIKSGSMLPTTSPATSITNGIGTVTFGAIS